MKNQICERCREKEASVYYKESVNGSSKEIRLCSDCARKMGIGFGGKSGLEEEFFSAFPLFAEPGSRERRESEGRVCSSCGKSREEIRQSGVFGCPRCYDAFSGGLDMTPFVGRGYGGGRLGGSAEENPAAGSAPENLGEKLKQELQEALKVENYEKAARLRDEIRALEGK